MPLPFTPDLTLCNTLYNYLFVRRISVENVLNAADSVDLESNEKNDAEKFRKITQCIVQHQSIIELSDILIH